MTRDTVRFSAEVPRETDVAVGKLAKVEGRASKRNMHVVLLNRIWRIWSESPDEAIRIGLVKPEPSERS